MTMSNELTLQEAALAWAQGKRVEAMNPREMPEIWMTVSKIGHDSRGSYTACVFNEDLGLYRFRLAPEPPVKKWRPWTPEEVPVGALVRFGNGKTGSHCWMITGWNAVSFHTSNSAYGPVLFEEAECKGCQHSLDNGKTWLPCGVEVEA